MDILFNNNNTNKNTNSLHNNNKEVLSAEVQEIL